ncbi:MAG: hypothetical protein LBM71_04975 [Elusimicrobiota bacterium]|jgi:hypothetical protein|nr:hypothetical protein [Elusimicrobiota bacterium]
MTKKKIMPIKEKHCIEEELDSFLHNLSSLELSFPFLLNLMDSFHGLAHNNFVEFINKVATQEKNKKGEDILRIKGENARKARKQEEKVKVLFTASELVAQQFVLSMVSQYDFFIGRLLRCLYQIKPEILNQSEKQLSYKDLSSFESIEAVKENIIEKEVDSFLRDSHLKQFETLEKKLSIDLRKDLDIFPTFIELTERRNLFAHTNGIVSSQYINICKKEDALFNKNIRKGYKIGVNLDYLKQASDCLLEIAIKLAHVIWQKIDEKTLEKSSIHILNMSYRFLQEKRYHLDVKILSFFTENQFKNKFNDNVYKPLKINLAQAYKWNGQEDFCKNIINSEDWSASSDLLLLAVAVLQDKTNDACLLMKNKKAVDLNARDYREWPLFQKMRKEQKFQETFKKVFKEDLFSTTERKSSREMNTQKRPLGEK